MHEGLSTSSQTQWLTKYVLTFVIDHCCSLQHSPLPNLSDGSSIFSPASSSTQTVFLDLRLGWSSFIPKIYGHHGNNSLVAAISLLETIINHEVCQMRFERLVGTTDMFLFAKNCSCFCFLVRSAALFSNTPLNFTGMCHMRGITCKQWKLYFFGLFKIFSAFSTLSSVLNVEGQPGCLQSSAAGFWCLNRGNTSVVCALPMALQSQDVLSISEQN